MERVEDWEGDDDLVAVTSAVTDGEVLSVGVELGDAELDVVGQLPSHSVCTKALVSTDV